MGEATNKINTTDWDDEPVTSTQRDDSYTASGSDDDFEEDTEQLRSDIEDTRAEMSQTINAIQERLSPEHLMGQVKETVREATIGKVERVMEQVGGTIAEATEPAREAMGRAGTAIKETGMSVGNSMWKNPIPVALIGLGVGLLMMRKYGGDGGAYQTPRTRRNFRTEYGGQNTGTLNQVKDTASDLANKSTEALSNLGTKARDSVSTAGSRLGQVLRENPLAVGAVAVAAGTAVGLALPSTRFESEYIGEASERLIDKAQDVAREAIDRVQNVAKEQMSPEGQKPGA